MLDAQAYFDRVSGHLPGNAATRASALAAAEKLGLPTLSLIHISEPTRPY